MIALIGTIIIFMFVAYIESVRIELPLAHGTARGARGRYPIKLIYASNIPVILMAALLANFQMITLAAVHQPHAEPDTAHRWQPDAGLLRTTFRPTRRAVWPGTYPPHRG